MELIITIVVFLLLIMIVIWGHFLRDKAISDNEQVSLRDETNVRLYHEHKAEIEKDFAEGGIDEENYKYLLEELDKSLLQDIEGNENDQAVKMAKQKKFSILWPSVLTVFVLSFSFALYMKTGAYQQLTDKQNNPQAHQTANEQGEHHDNLNAEQQMTVRIQQLQKLVEENPNNTEAWYGLGQVLIGAGDFDNAISAFNKVIEIEGEQADLLGAIAQASYYKNDQKIDENVQQFIDRALALDPNDPSTNILLGMHNFMNQNYQQSINYWQRVVDSNTKNVNAAALKEAITEAKSRLSLTGKQPDTIAKDDANNTQGPQLHLNVTVSEQIAQLLAQGEDKVVFIYAVPANGTRMPVAAVKIMASDLPTEVVLNDSRAMSPQANLSSVEKVHLYAVVSSKGGVGIKTGDYKAEVNDIDVSKVEPISLTINTIVQ